MGILLLKSNKYCVEIVIANGSLTPFVNLKYWVWIALDHNSRMIVAFHVGKRDEKSCQSFWQKIPPKLGNKAISY